MSAGEVGGEGAGTICLAFHDNICFNASHIRFMGEAQKPVHVEFFERQVIFLKKQSYIFY